MRQTRHLAVALASVVLCVVLDQTVPGAQQQPAASQASEVTVQPVPAPLIPEGNTGIAAKYPGDVGIEKDSDYRQVGAFPWRVADPFPALPGETRRS